MKKYLYTIAILIIVIIPLFISSRFVLPYVLSAYLGRQLRAEVTIKSASLSIRDGIRVEDILIANQKGLKCNIESGIIVPSLRGTGFKFKNIELSYPNSKIINSISEALSIAPLELFKFDSIKGKVYPGRRESIIKSLDADGKLIRLFVDATITNNSEINCSLKILLSGKLIEKIPESTKELFFKKDGAWSKVELYLTGDINKPSINFSTDLFKLVIR